MPLSFQKEYLIKNLIHTMRIISLLILVTSVMPVISQNTDSLTKNNVYYEKDLTNIETKNYALADNNLLDAAKYSNDSIKLANYHYTCALIAFEKEQPELCKASIETALTLDSTMGTAYILLGKAYAKFSEICEFNEPFERCVVYCLAVDKFELAKAIDTTLYEEADELIELYSKYFPESMGWQITEKTYYEFECWIQEGTIIRWKK